FFNRFSHLKLPAPKFIVRMCLAQQPSWSKKLVQRGDTPFRCAGFRVRGRGHGEVRVLIIAWKGITVARIAEIAKKSKSDYLDAGRHSLIWILCAVLAF